MNKIQASLGSNTPLKMTEQKEIQKKKANQTFVVVVLFCL